MYTTKSDLKETATPKGSNGPWKLRSGGDRPLANSTVVELLDPRDEVKFRGLYYQSEQIGVIANDSHADGALSALRVIEIVGDKVGPENVKQWLTSPIEDLGGDSPVDAIKDGRIAEVEEILAA